VNDGEVDGHGHAPDALDDITPGATAQPTPYLRLLAPIHALGWRRVRRAAYVAYLALLVWIVIADGVPTGRTVLAAVHGGVTSL
jgi:hypothetical protein